MATDTTSCDYCGAHATHAAMSTPNVHRPGCPVPAHLHDADALIALLESVATPKDSAPCACAGRD